MSLRYWLQQPGGTLLDVTDRCRKWVCDLGEKAEEGATQVNTVVFDDPDGSLTLYGHRIFAVEETDAVDPDDRFIFVGFIGQHKVSRGPYRTGAARIWTSDVSDPNTIFERRVMTGGDNDRPDEDDVDRVAWVESTHEGEAIDDTRYLLTDDPEAMDEADYNTQQASAVYGDCSQQSGKNWYLTYFGDVGVTDDTPWGSFSLWYGAAESEEYLSSAMLTNIESEVDIAAGTFYIGVVDDTAMMIDPMRIYSTVVVPYANGYVTASRSQTVETYGRRDRVMPAENVKKAATAQRRANRYVRSLNTPDHRATVKTTVPRAAVNLIRPGMGVPVKVSHWPHGYADEYLTMRVLSRRVVEVSDDPDQSFELTLELSRGEPGPPAPPLYGILYVGFGPRTTEYGTNVYYYANPGDTPGPGFLYKPTTGLITPLQDATPPGGNGSWYAWRVDGDGTIDVNAFQTLYGIKMDNIAYTWTLAICLNGVPVASNVHNPVPGNLSPEGWSPSVSVTGLAVANGDLITVTATSSPKNPEFWTSPFGTGQDGERLEITGGELS